MTVRNVLIMTIIGVMSWQNFNMTVYYYENYEVSNFTRAKLMSQKYRCIRYYAEKDFIPHMENKCRKFKHNFVVFSLQKSAHVFYYIIYNIIFIALIIVIYLVLH